MAINSINNIIVNKKFQSFKNSQEDCKDYITSWQKSSNKSDTAKKCSVIGFILGLLLLCTSQFEHSPNLTRFEKFGVGLLILSTFSLLYQSYKVGKQNLEELDDEEDISFNAYA